MNDIEKNTTDLDDLFEAARSETADLPVELAQRIIAGAHTIQNEQQKTNHRHRPGFVSQVLTLLGGWPAVGGLAAACAAGVWLGFAPPAAMPDPIAFMQQSETELFDEDDMIFAMNEEG